MAGGTFNKLAGKVRPGTYVNFKSSVVTTIGNGERGIAVIPFLQSTYGPKGKWISIGVENPDAEIAKLGYSVLDDDANKQMLLVREAFKNAVKVLVYICSEGTKATATLGALTVTAKYGGTRGNSFKVSVVANVVSGFDVTVYLGKDVVDVYEGVSTVENLISVGSDFVTFTGTGNLTAQAGKNLAGGTDATATNTDITAFLNDLEGVEFNCAALPSTDNTIQASAKTKIKYMRENIGKCVQIVIPDGHSNYEGVICVSNAYAIGDVELTHAQACAWVAGATAGCSETESLTYKTVDGATSVVDKKTHEQSVAAINAGEFFFSPSESGNVIVEYDINSLVTFDDEKDSTYRKNRVIRVLDGVRESLQNNFHPNKFENSEKGWDVMEGVGKSILALYENAGAITDVDYDSDFLVDRENSKGDSTYFNVGIQPVDSAEKLYFTVTTR